MIIGLTGTNQAGKTKCGDYLKQKGFEYFSHSDELRTICAERGGNPNDREQLINLGNELRSKYGVDYITNILIRKIRESDSKNSIADSCRNPGEVERLRREGDFFLLAIDAPPQMRYERGIIGGRIPSNMSFEQFISQEMRENSKDPAGQQLHIVRGMANYLIWNDSEDVTNLYKKIDNALIELGIIEVSRV